MGLLGAIGGFAQNQVQELKTQQDQDFKTNYLQMSLDSKNEIAQARNDAN